MAQGAHGEAMTERTIDAAVKQMQARLLEVYRLAASGKIVTMVSQSWPETPTAVSTNWASGTEYTHAPLPTPKEEEKPRIVAHNRAVAILGPKRGRWR